jgi:FkbM family methyltransferase
MNDILVAKFPKLPQAFAVRRLPFLCRFYQYVFWPVAAGRPGFWLRRILKMFFPFVRRAFGSSKGEFEFHAQGKLSTIQFNPRNLEFHVIYNQAIYKNGYEVEVAALLNLLLPEKGVFYDIGSNWGYHSLIAVSQRPQLKVHAFEPTPETFQDLTACVNQAGLGQSVTCHNFALSSNDGKAFIKLPDHLHSGCAEVSKEGGDASISTRRLDSLDLPKPDFIKMDVEWHELEVLKGAVETIKSSRPHLIFENKLDHSNPKKVLDVFAFLAGLGYRFFLPAANREPGGDNFLMPSGWLPVAEDENLALIPFTTQTRLLCFPEFNVFACHESRLPELMKTFRVWNE